MPLILPGNVASATADTGYTVDNSCRFNDDDPAYLTRTFGADGNSRTFTVSFWFKPSSVAGERMGIFSGGPEGTGYRGSYIWLDDQLTLREYIDEDVGVSNLSLVSNAILRDPSAWYHICVKYDTTQSTEANRVIPYINGEQVTSFVGTTYPDQNYDFLQMNKGQLHRIGRYNDSYPNPFNGYLAEFVFIDGTAYGPTSFGEFDEDSPTIWKPIDVSGLTFGTNGFYLDFKNSSELGTDVSGNSNDFTENNLDATDQATDTPTNNFATLNPLVVINGSTFSEGNCKVVTGSSPYSYDVSTIGVANGKWYVEAKYGGSSDDATFGIAGRTATDTTHELGQYDDTWSYYTGTGASNVRNNNSNSSYGATYTTNDIIGLALDLTNNKLYFSKNGAWQNSGDPESGATGTGAVDITAASSVTDGVYYIAVGDFDGGASVTWEINFGNPSYTGTDQDDDNGYGSFEYDPPSGYYALCTKNLAEFGG